MVDLEHCLLTCYWILLQGWLTWLTDLAFPINLGEQDVIPAEFLETDLA